MRALRIAALCTLLAGGNALAQSAADAPDFPTAPRPPSGDAFPERMVEFPDGIVAIGDVTYDTQVGFRPLALDIYHDPAATEPKPVILYIHGGGWERSHKRAAGVFTDFPGVLASFASRGFVVASAEYRLSGEAPFPAALHDVKAAIRFLRDNADKYGIDPERFGIWGSSAGGHLASLAAVSCDQQSLDVFSTAKPETSTCVDAAAIWYGIFDFSTMGPVPEQSLAGDSRSRFLGCNPGYCTNYVVASASPVSFVDDKSPPFLLAHGTEDKVVPISQSREFEEKLKGAGVDVQTLYVEGVDHSFVAPDEALARSSALTAANRTFEFFVERLNPSQ
ncbi:alpha/beta hydrolase [Aquamicrobium sp. LC103]|uniref:alpha/beta hydrolase n=1 Tax=Aquamicrobium sp. LC103 TaxID=1120658 RepID=UPI00063E91B2|nr:alpha/beta hydrolase [Aquamicrobium sp. LC103]